MLELLIPNPVLAHAIEAMLYASITCSILGVIITRMQLSSIGFTMAHAAFAGAAAGLFFTIDPLFTAIACSLTVAALLGPISDRGRLSPDVTLGVLFGLLMAVAIFFISYMEALGRGFSASGLLFGNVISLYAHEVVGLGLICGVAVLFVVLFSKEITAIACHRRMAEAAGIYVRPIYYLTLFMIALSVSLCIQIIGGLLLYVWLVTPAAIAYQFCASMKQTFVVAPVLAAIISTVGAYTGLEYSLPVAPYTAILFSIVFAVAIIISPRRKIPKNKT
jgi:zinc/manganese transport system permease protein